MPASAYAAFLGFVLCAIAGALVTFHATRTRFKYPSRGVEGGGAKSLLFHGGILSASPRDWALGFATVKDGQTAFVDLRREYLRNYVMETYLVAAKTADKLRYLQPAQSLLAWALRFLLMFAVASAATVMSLKSTKPHPNPTRVLVDQPRGPMRVDANVTMSR